MNIAVIIPFRGDAATLEWALDGLRHQHLAVGEQVEVRVCGDGVPVPALPGPTISIGDRKVSFIGKEIEWSGVATAKNAVLRGLPADIVIFLNADTWPSPNFVATHVDRLRTLPAGWMVVGGSPYETPSSPTVFDVFKEDTPAIFFYNQMSHGGTYDFRHAWGLNTSVRYADIAALDFFNDQLTPYGYEDLDLAYRLMGERKQVLYDSEATVVHRHPMTLENYLDREEKLGLMMTVLAEANRELFRYLSGVTTLSAWIDECRSWLDMDPSMPEWVYRRMQEWAVQPADVLGTGPWRERMLGTLYQMHLPLKRWAFRQGAVAAMDMGGEAAKRERWKVKHASAWREALKRVLVEASA